MKNTVTITLTVDETLTLELMAHREKLRKEYFLQSLVDIGVGAPTRETLIARGREKIESLAALEQKLKQAFWGAAAASTTTEGVSE